MTPSVNGTTLPGATITVETPHWGLEQDFSTGEFSFHPLFSTLGDNDVVIRASYEGKTDSVITHTVYYMPNWDIYTRRAWDLDSQYNDLINKAKVETDAAVRLDEMLKAEKLLVEQDCVVSGLYHRGAAYLIDDSVNNFVMHPFGVDYEFKYASFN